MKSGSGGSYYLPGQLSGTFVSTPDTAGPWGPEAQHGGPPSGLMTRALEALLTPDQVLGRIAVDLLGPVPVGPLEVSTSVVRPGRAVSLLSASLVDLEAGRECATARAWVLPRLSAGPGSVTPLPHKPDDGVPTPIPSTWHRDGYLNNVEWLWISGAVGEPGPATVWARSLLPLLPGEEMTGTQRLMACIDSASGMSSVLDPTEWSFMNTDVSVHIVREPVGDWVCIDAETALVGTGVGMTTAIVYDERGLVGRSAQALLIRPATGRRST